MPMQSVSQKQMPWVQKQQVLIGHGLTGIVAGLGNERSFNKSVDPYRRVDGQLVANDFTDLLNNQLKAPINVTAQGVTIATELVTVWTDVKADGSPFGPTCDGWANIEADGRVGNGRVMSGLGMSIVFHAKHLCIYTALNSSCA